MFCFPLLALSVTLNCPSVSFRFHIVAFDCLMQILWNRVTMLRTKTCRQRSHFGSESLTILKLYPFITWKQNVFCTLTSNFLRRAIDVLSHILYFRYIDQWLLQFPKSISFKQVDIQIILDVCFDGKYQ